MPQEHRSQYMDSQGNSIGIGAISMKDKGGLEINQVVERSHAPQPDQLSH